MRQKGLCSILLMFEAVPRPGRESLAPTQFERARVIEKVISEFEKEHGKRRTVFRLNYEKGPEAVQSSEPLKKLPARAPV